MTVVVPTRNRPHNLRRLLDFYEELDFNPQFYIADSSDGTLRTKSEKICADRDLDLEYDTFPVEMRLIEKIRDALCHVSTSYTVLCADDDFVMPSGINQAVRFLSNNKSFSAAHGNYISFRAEQSVSDIRFDWSPSYVDSQSLDERNPADRLQNHHANYTPTFYSVHRTPSIRTGYEKAVEATTDVRFGELLPSMTAVINGKFKHLDIFYAARYSAQQTGATADDFLDFIRERSFTSKYDCYRDSLADHLESQSDLTLNEALITVDDAMISYLINSYDLTQQEATNLVKEGRVPEGRADKGSDEPTNSQSLPVKVRDWLRTTPVPNEIIANIESIYRSKNRYQNFMRSMDFERAKSYMLLDEPIGSKMESLEQVRQSVKSHPKALEE